MPNVKLNPGPFRQRREAGADGMALEAGEKTTHEVKLVFQNED